MAELERFPAPNVHSMQPATYFYRTALRERPLSRDRLELALMLCDEVDHLKKQIRTLGKRFGVELIPGRVYDPTSLLSDDDRQMDLFQERA